MRNTLFNSEVEGFTREKFSSIKIGILGIAILAGAAFVGWMWNVGTWVQLFMDVFTDVSA